MLLTTLYVVGWTIATVAADDGVAVCENQNRDQASCEDQGCCVYHPSAAEGQNCMSAVGTQPCACGKLDADTGGRDCTGDRAYCADESGVEGADLGKCRTCEETGCLDVGGDGWQVCRDVGDDCSDGSTCSAGGTCASSDVAGVGAPPASDAPPTIAPPTRMPSCNPTPTAAPSPGGVVAAGWRRNVPFASWAALCADRADDGVCDRCCNSTAYPDGQEGGDCTYAVADAAHLDDNDARMAEDGDPNEQMSKCGWPLGAPADTCALISACDVGTQAAKGTLTLFAEYEDGSLAGFPYRDACRGEDSGVPVFGWPWKQPVLSYAVQYEGTKCNDGDGCQVGICPRACRATQLTTDAKGAHTLPPVGDLCNIECAFEACRFHAHACVQFADHAGSNHFRHLGALEGAAREGCARGATAAMASVGAFSPLRALHREGLAAYTAALALGTDAERAAAHEREQRDALDARYFFETTLSFPYAGLSADFGAVECLSTKSIAQTDPTPPHAARSLAALLREDNRRERLAVVTCTNATHYAARIARDINNKVDADADADDGDVIERMLQFKNDFVPCGDAEIVWASGGACSSSPAAEATCKPGFRTRADQLYVRKFRTPNYAAHQEFASNLLPLAISGLNAAGAPILPGGEHAGAAPALACAACREGHVARVRARVADTYCNGAWLMLPVQCAKCPHPENCANSGCVPGMDYLTLCETCVRGFYKSRTVCLPCSFSADWVKELPVMFVCMLVLTLGLMLWVKKGSGRGGVAQDIANMIFSPS